MGVVLQFFGMDFARKLSFLVFLLCLLISLKNQHAETNKALPTASWASSDSAILDTPYSGRPMFLSNKIEKLEEVGYTQTLEYDFYRESCPQAEQIIRTMVQRLSAVRLDVAPALLRLAFHDCFVEGCDASVLLDSIDGSDSEKESPPNETLKGYDIVDIIKSEIEEACPGIVSCADILVLAAREGVVLSGGPFYPLHTGRRDSTRSFSEVATYGLPSPHDDLPKTIASFASRGFDERETVSLLGAHSIGMIHCKFFLNRLYSFGGTDRPDPSIDADFLNLLRSRCNNSHTPQSASPSPFAPPPSSLTPSSLDGTPSSSHHDQGMKMDYEEPRIGFGSLYYRGLLQGKGILYVDQQLMAGEATETWVRAYAADTSLFRRDFALAMMKLSSLQVLTSPMGQVRSRCSKVA